jgi:hypothetical protein
MGHSDLASEGNWKIGNCSAFHHSGPVVVFRTA